MEDGIRAPILNLLFSILILSFTGCAGYHLGPVNPALRAGARSVGVLPFNDQTLQPRLGDAVTQALRERLQSDGTYHLASHGRADIEVTGTLTGYVRQPISFLKTDIATANIYRIEVTAHVIARDRDSGTVLLDREVRGYTMTQTGTELAETERQSMPLLAEDLARRISALLTEGAW